MAGKKDIVEQALKLIAGGAKEAAPTAAERTAKNLDVFSTAKRLGEDTNDLAKLQETKRLMEYHKGLMGDVKERARSLSETIQQMKEAGAFPMEIGTRYTTEHSRRTGQSPWTVTNYYVDPKNPQGSYGYYVRRDLPDGGYEESISKIRDPKLEALHGPEKWEELQRGFVPMTGPRAVKQSGGRTNYGPGGDVGEQQPMAFLEDAIGNKYDTAGNIIPQPEQAINDALTTARAETYDPYAEEIASAKKLMADQAYDNQSWSDWASDAGRNLYETGMSFLPTDLGGRGEVGISDLAKGVYESAKSGATLPGDVLTGKTNVFDPATGGLTDEVMRRGMDLTGFMTLGAGAIPAEANSLRMGMKGAPEAPKPTQQPVAPSVPAPEDAALKAAQEAVGEDQAAAATRMAQLESLNPIEPPKGIPAPEHALGTQRGTRTVIAPSSIKLSPSEQAVVNSFKSRADRAIVASRIRETKARYPKSDGWSPFEAVGAEIDEKGNPVIKWQEQKYGFNTAKQPGMATQVDPVTGEKFKAPVFEERALRVGTPEYEKAAKRATKNGVDAVQDIVLRAAEGDEAALKIIRQAGWYREFMRKGFDERGGSYPAFSDLLGATSPNTAVDQNYRYSVDLQNRFARGDFDEPVKFASEYEGSLNAFPENKLIFRDPVGPKGPQKLQYGMNSRNAQMALADKWRQKEPGQAPKARNFSGNLGGATDEATIDVWAARFINRMAGRKRLPPPVESGVKGKLGANLVPTGEFGYGQDVFRRMTDELNRRGNLLPYLRELGYDNLTPMDMQALTWFIEKEHWTKNNWTTAAGEGGSFEDELLKYPSERWQSGVSIQQADAPSDEAMAATRNVFENSLRDDPNVNQYRVHPTIGRYAGNNERSFDLELTAKPGWDPRTWMAAVIREAQANNQYDVFFSKRLSPEVAQTNPNARPGVEIYFRDRKTLDEALPILEEFTKRNADGFTFVTDLRLRERELGGKEAPDFVGVRMQWVPEIRSRWDEEFRNAVEADPAVLEATADEALDAMQAALFALDKAGLGVVDARVHHYDTLTVGKESYDKFLDGIADPENAAGTYEGRAGAPVDPVRRFGQPLYSHVAGRNRALRTGPEGGQPDAGGDVVGTGQSSGPLTPEARAANFQSTFGQTYLKDPQGNPMRLYHLTPNDITEFSASDANRAGPVVYLSPYPEFQPAHHQAGVMGERGEFTGAFREGANVMPVYADVRNPLVLDHPRKIKEAAAKYQNGDREFPRYVSPAAKAAMEADGYDAIIFGGENPIPYGDRPMDARLGHQEARDEEFIIFDPKKIKSAIGNRGTYDTSTPDITKALGGAIDDEDIDNALRLARAMGGRAGYAEAGSVPVLMEDAKGNKYDAQGKIIPPANPGPNPARSDVTLESVAAKAVNDPATYDAIMERYAIPDRDIAQYEATKAEVAKQPQDIRQMTHLGDKPTREVKVDMPLLGGEYSMGRAPYDVAAGKQGILQTAYDFKTMPAYFFPATAPFALGADVLESRLADDPLGFALNAALTPQGASAAKSALDLVRRNPKIAAGLAGIASYFTPDEAEAGPERWFSKLVRAAEALPMEKMTGEQALAMLRKTAPSEEIKWTNLEGFASDNPVTTKQALLDYLKKNQVQTQDVVLGAGPKPTRREDVVLDADIKAQFRDKMAEAHSNLAKAQTTLLRTKPGTPEYKTVEDDLFASQKRVRELENAVIDAQIEKIGGLGRATKYQSYSTPGGEGYRETLVTLPGKGPSKDEISTQMFGKPMNELSSIQRILVGQEYSKINEGGFSYKSPHWDDPNVIGHIRSQILTATPPGANRPMKLFNVDESQSDLAQAGRKTGFKDTSKNWASEFNSFVKQMNSDWVETKAQKAFKAAPHFYDNDLEKARQFARDVVSRRGATLVAEDLGIGPQYRDLFEKMDAYNRGMQPAPYVTSTQNWTDLSIKKALDQAIDSGADYFTFTPGEVQAARYDLSKHIDTLSYNPNTGSLGAWDDEGRRVIDESILDETELDNYVGKELAEKLRTQVNGLPVDEDTLKKKGYAKLSGLDLKVGGEGMIDYYNNIYKKRLEKVVKDLTGKKVQWEVLPAETAEGIVPRLGFRIDDDLKEAKFPTFASGGVVNKALELTRDY